MNLTRPTPAGALFDVSAIAVRKIERIALTLGAMVDIVRDLTVRPLSASQRVLVCEAFERLGRFDAVRDDCEASLRALRRVAREVEEMREN